MFSTYFTGSRPESNGMEVEGSASVMQDLTQGHLRSSSTHVDTHEHETLQLAYEVTDDRDGASELIFPRRQPETVIQVSLLYLNKIYCISMNIKLCMPTIVFLKSEAKPRTWVKTSQLSQFHRETRGFAPFLTVIDKY